MIYIPYKRNITILLESINHKASWQDKATFGEVPAAVGTFNVVILNKLNNPIIILFYTCISHFHVKSTITTSGHIGEICILPTEEKPLKKKL